MSNPVRLLVAAHCAVSILSLPGQSRADSAFPTHGPFEGGWSEPRTAQDAARHDVRAAGAVHYAVNPGQRWRTEFDGRGFLTVPRSGHWSWGLELQSYGAGGNECAVARPARVRADRNLVSYDWDEALTEWFVNDARGLEHGFTVHQRPSAGAGPLQFQLAVRGELCPSVSAEGRDVRFLRHDGVVAVNYAGLTVFDARGVEVASRFELAGEGLKLIVDDRGAEYPLTIDPLAQQARLTPSQAVGNFGRCAAASGDTVVVGAPDSGAFVFVRGEDGTWTEQKFLVASNMDVFDNFGESVAISGDTIVVGATGEDGGSAGVNGDQSSNTLSASGAAYVFVRSGTTWVQQAYLKASNPGADDNFGCSVAISGDTIVVGARNEDSNATGVNGNQADNSAASAGAAYVFVRSGGVWSQQAYLKAAEVDAVDLFGSSVAIAGDTIVVGVPFDDSAATGINGDPANDTATDAGAAYIFVRSGTTWSQQAYLKPTIIDDGDNFGGRVAISGDTVVIGAEFEDGNGTGTGGNPADNTAQSSGAAYVFFRSGGVWSQQAYLKASNTEQFDEFGHSVAIAGDQILVGTVGEDGGATGIDGNQADNTAPFAGAAYLYVRSGATWSHQSYLKGSNSRLNGNFGASLGISDGVIVVGGTDEAFIFEFDFDADGRADAADNCPTVANAGQADGDADGVGDVCDLCPGLGGAVDLNGCPLDNDADGDPDVSDCDDSNPAIHAGAAEICDGVDNDCDGQIDEDGVCDSPATPPNPNPENPDSPSPDSQNPDAPGADAGHDPALEPGGEGEFVESPSGLCVGTAAIMLALTFAGIARARRLGC